jgi:hypothetical protein
LIFQRRLLLLRYAVSPESASAHMRRNSRSRGELSSGLRIGATLRRPTSRSSSWKALSSLGKHSNGTKCPAIGGIIKETDETAGEI